MLLLSSGLRPIPPPCLGCGYEAWGRLGASWAILGLCWAVLGPSWGRLGPSWAVFTLSVALRVVVGIVVSVLVCFCALAPNENNNPHVEAVSNDVITMFRN